MKSGLVIAGFAGIGKTYLAKKYTNVIDLESSPYKYNYTGIDTKEYESLNGNKNRVRNPQFPNNYIAAIKEAQKKYDVVFVFLDERNLLNEYEKNGIDYVICYPDEEALKKYYLNRFLQRGNSKEFSESTLNWWYSCIGHLKHNTHPKIVLHNNETIEDCLLKNGYLLELR